MPSYLMIWSMSCMVQVMSSVFSCLQVFGASITDAILSHDMLIVMFASGYAKCFLVFTGVWGQYNRCHPNSSLCMPQVMSSFFLCLQVFGASITDAILSHDMLIVMYASGYVKCFLVFTGVWDQYNGCHLISRYSNRHACLRLCQVFSCVFRCFGPV